jgi:hypothetical protein
MNYGYTFDFVGRKQSSHRIGCFGFSHMPCNRRAVCRSDLPLRLAHKGIFAREPTPELAILNERSVTRPLGFQESPSFESVEANPISHKSFATTTCDLSLISQRTR